MNSKNKVLSEWLAGIACVAILLTVFWLMLAEISAPPVQDDEHFSYIARLCPHLQREHQTACIEWLRKGGAE